jgi:integrating conjugative element membrane protein (TIGR03747 family)
VAINLLKFPIHMISWLAVSWLITQLILTIFIFWQDHYMVLLRSKQLFNTELHHSINNLQSFWLRSIWRQENFLIHYLHDLSVSIPSLSDVIPITHNATIVKVLQIIYPPLCDIAQAMIVTTQTLLLRVTNVLLFIPLILLLGVVGFANGLVQRYIRRINGGRESSLIYHYAKISIKPFLYWGSLLYVALPFPLEPAHWLTPCVVASSLAVFLTVSTFKKYS